MLKAQKHIYALFLMTSFLPLHHYHKIFASFHSVVVQVVYLTKKKSWSTWEIGLWINLWGILLIKLIKGKALPSVGVPFLVRGDLREKGLSPGAQTGTHCSLPNADGCVQLLQMLTVWLPLQDGLSLEPWAVRQSFSLKKLWAGYFSTATQNESEPLRVVPYPSFAVMLHLKSSDLSSNKSPCFPCPNFLRILTYLFFFPVTQLSDCRSSASEHEVDAKHPYY